MPVRKERIPPCVLGALLYLGVPAADAREPEKPLAWAPKPSHVIRRLAAPNRLHWELSEILAAHAGQRDWSQSIIKTRDFICQYIAMSPGKKTKTVFYSEDRVFWVVQAGQMRVTIEGQTPFIAAKGFLVQIPYRVPYSMETVGDTPSLRFEVRPANALPLYPIAETPTPVPGHVYVRATYSADHGSYDQMNKPYIDFDKDVVLADLKTANFIRDDHTAAHITRGNAAQMPSDAAVSHFHEDLDEIWLVLEGQADVLIEGAPHFAATPGDVVFAPAARNFRVTFGGHSTSGWMALLPRPTDNHLYPLDADGQ